ncbi:hypothetical protein FRC17_011078 [Serendipita sp. 399]|nr:hypothetical protein FRC17_011078 [Serendipita sp. 399]
MADPFASPTPSTIAMLGGMGMNDEDHTITLSNRLNYIPPEDRIYATTKRITINMETAMLATPEQPTSEKSNQIEGQPEHSEAPNTVTAETQPSDETDRMTASNTTENQPTNPTDTPTNDGTASLRAALESLKDEAKQQAGLELFSLAPILAPIKLDRARPNESIISKALNAVEWIQINSTGLAENLLHQSGNPLDFMRDDTIMECQKAAKGQENQLGLTKMILIEPIYRILVRVAQTNCPKENQMIWTKHAIRSVLSKAGIPLDGLVAMLDMRKLGYDWKVAALSKSAFEVMKGIRALHDPRTRTTVFLRKWDLNPPKTQTLCFNGIATRNDTSEKERELQLKIFVDELQNKLTEQEIQIVKAWNSTSKEEATTTHITFKIPENKPLRIEPRSMPHNFKAIDGTRAIKASWLRKCPTCHSESHWKEEKCPWVSFSFEGKLMDMHNAKKFQPGQSEGRKREREAGSIEIGLADARTAKRTKKEMTATSEENAKMVS